MDRRTLTITAIIAGLIFVAEIGGYLAPKNAGAGEYVSLGIGIWLVTWAAVALIRWAKRRFGRPAVRAEVDR